MTSNTMRERTNPEAVFDFDGTLVHLAQRSISLQNALKYPMYAKTEAHRFIQGIASTGVEIGPIISRRPRIGRTFVTQRTLRDTGLSRWFDDRSDVILAGSINPTKFKRSETFKAIAILNRAEQGVVGVVEDKPNKLGSLLLNGLVQRGKTNEPLIIGVAPSEQAQTRTWDLARHAESQDWHVEEQQADEDEMAGFVFSRSYAGVDMLVKVVQLNPFDHDAGVQFGRQLQFYAA